MIGGAGSGKSVFAAQKLLFRIITEQGHRFLGCRKYAASLRRSAVQLILDSAEAFGITKYMDFVKTDFSIKFPLFRSEILFTGLDDTEKLKSITGITGAWVEEASEADPGDLKELNRRIRGVTPGYKQIMLTTNPVASAVWIKRGFIDTGRATVLKTTYRDNRFLDQEYIDELLTETDPYHRAVYTEGDFAELKGLVFPNVVFRRFKCVEADFREVLTGMDFGFNDPTAVIKCAVRDGELYILDEFYQRGLTNRDLIGAMRGVLDPRRTVVADSAEPDRIAEFNRDGFRVVGARKGRDSIKTGLDFLRRFKAINIDQHITPNIAREISEYRYAESKDGIVQELPVGKNDHTLDALRYAVEPLWKTREVRSSANVASALGIY
jgi:phage terminase large subunit